MLRLQSSASLYQEDAEECSFLMVTRELSALKLSGYVHENIVRYYGDEDVYELDGEDQRKKWFT